MCGGQVVWFTDRSGQGALSQAGEEHLALGLGDAVPHRCSDRTGPDGVDTHGGELDRQTPDQALGGSSSGGGERCAGNRSLSDRAGGQPDRSSGPDPWCGVLDHGDRTPESDVEDGACFVESEVDEGTRGECVPSGEREVVQLPETFEQGGDGGLVTDVQCRALAAGRQLVQCRVDPVLSSGGDRDLRTVQGRRPSGRQTHARTASDHHDLLTIQGHVCLQTVDVSLRHQQ